MSSNFDPLSQLSLQIASRIISFLEPIDIVKYQRVSRHWKTILDSESIYTRGLHTHFPFEPETNDIWRRQSRKEPTSNDVRKVYRRLCFRSVERRSGSPVEHREYRTASKGIMAWDSNCGTLAWVERGHLILQNIRDGAGGRRSIKLEADCDRVHLVKVDGKNVFLLSKTSNFTIYCYSTESSGLHWKHEIESGSMPVLSQNCSSEGFAYGLTRGTGSGPWTVVVISLESGKSLYQYRVDHVADSSDADNGLYLTPDASSVIVITRMRNTNHLLRIFSLPNFEQKQDLVLNRHNPPNPSRWNARCRLRMEFSESNSQILAMEDVSVKPRHKFRKDGQQHYTFSSWIISLAGSDPKVIGTRRHLSYVRLTENVDPHRKSGIQATRKEHLFADETAMVWYDVTAHCCCSRLDFLAYDVPPAGDQLLQSLATKENASELALVHNFRQTPRKSVAKPEVGIMGTRAVQRRGWGQHVCDAKYGQPLDEADGSDWLLFEAPQDWKADGRYCVLRYNGIEKRWGEGGGWFVLDFEGEGSPSGNQLP